MRPADALDRIVYLLDRDLAESTKVRAFARARDVVLEVGDDEIERLHAAGKVTDLPGIGPSTGGVIAQALDGEVPDYLARLEDETVIPLGDGRRPARPPSGATATPTRPGPTAGRRSRRWPAPPSPSATTTWSSPTTPPA